MSISKMIGTVYQGLSLPPASSEGARIYGELYPESWAHCVSQYPFKESDVFVDLGSGTGKVVIQTFCTTPVHKAIGIELDEQRHLIALKAGRRLQQMAPTYFPDRELTFVAADFLSTSLSEATVVYCCATAYPVALLIAISHHLNAHPHIRLLFSLRPIPFLEHLVYTGRVVVECSWDSALAYVYARK